MINPLVYFLVFLKASLFSSGGLANLPSVRQDLLARGWASESQFGQAVAIGQISPGPNGLWVVSLGYFTYGVAGAILALIAITLPPLLALVVSAQYARVEGQPWVQGAMQGVSVAVIALLIAVIWTVLRQPGIDGWGLLIAGCAFALAFSRKVNLLLILALAGGVGYLLYH